MAHTEHIDSGYVPNTKDKGLWSGGKSPFQSSYGKIMMWYFLVSDAFTFAAFLITYGALRFSSPSWPLPDYVFSKLPFGIEHKPLIFVTIMTFVLIVSSVTMLRAVQEGKRENKSGVLKFLILTVIGGATFLGCQAWEWTTLFSEGMYPTQNPFSVHTVSGKYMEAPSDHGILAHHEGKEIKSFKVGEPYMVDSHHETRELLPRKIQTADGAVVTEPKGPMAFGALFFFITGFHGFHVFSGLVILTIIAINVGSGLYVERKNGYEMVEKVGLYWHFVDLVWVFVFLLFYLL
jgi:cytochrome c oxidase subunit 3